MNVELVKLVLDIAMVAVYFLLAAFAVRQPVETRPETLLVVCAFVLYACWDLASVYQRRGDERTNPYRAVWKERFEKEWEGPNWGRVQATWAALVVAGVVCACAWFIPQRATTLSSTAIDAVLVVLLIGYRIVKDWWGASPTIGRA